MAGTRKYSSGVSDAEQATLLRSVEAREARRQKQLEALPIEIGKLLGGRRRPEMPVSTPQVIPKDMLTSLGLRLKRRGEIVTDQFTRKIPSIKSTQRYIAYIQARNNRDEDTATSYEQQKQSVLALQRKEDHIKDKLHRNVWQQWQLARINNAAVGHVLRAGGTGTQPRKDALLLTASAIEDIGFCLFDHPIMEGMYNGKRWLPTRLIQIGQFAANEPQSLGLQHRELSLVVLREQQRREQFWGETLTRYEDPTWGDVRRSEQDILDEQQNDAFILELG